MNFFDIIVIVIIAWTAFKGFSKGFISQAAAFAALLLGIFGAIKFSGFTSQFIIKKFESNNEYIPLIAFAVTFILIVIGVHFVAKMTNKLANAVALGFVNRIFGMMFAILKMSFIISIVLVLLTRLNAYYSFLPAPMLKNSLLYNPLLSFAPVIFPYLKSGLPQNDDMLNIIACF